MYWLLQDRGELKLVCHGRNLNKLGLPHDRIQATMELSGLAGLVCASYDTIDKGMLSAFVEMWHMEETPFIYQLGS